MDESWNFVMAQQNEDIVVTLLDCETRACVTHKAFYFELLNTRIQSAIPRPA